MEAVDRHNHRSVGLLIANGIAYLLSSPCYDLPKRHLATGTVLYNFIDEKNWSLAPDDMRRYWKGWLESEPELYSCSYGLWPQMLQSLVLGHLLASSRIQAHFVFPTVKSRVSPSPCCTFLNRFCYRHLLPPPQNDKMQPGLRLPKAHFRWEWRLPPCLRNWSASPFGRCLNRD